MTSRLLKCALYGLAVCASVSAWGAFKDPLETPAQINLELAKSNRMTAIAQAGSRLVAAGPRGHVLISDDQGRTWAQVPVPVSVDLVSIRFVTPTQGWAVGHDGVVLHSADAGSSWEKQLDGKQAIELMKRHFEQRAGAGDEEAGALLEVAMRYAEEGPDKPFLDVLFLDEHQGFVVGAFNLAFRTRDGGKSWEPLLGRIDNPRSLHLYALAQSSGQLYLAGEQGLLLRWNPVSERFESMESPYNGSYFGLLGTDSALVAYGLRGNAYVSRDGGRSWQREETGVTDSITGAASLPGGGFVLATQGGKLLLDKGEGALREIHGSRPMAYFSVVSAGPQTVTVVGSGGVQVESISSQ
ncbi:Ycf48-like protein [compost metagenome]